MTGRARTPEVEHFLDATILFAHALHWDRHANRVRDYLQRQRIRRTSSHVHGSVKTALQKFRTNATAFLTVVATKLPQAGGRDLASTLDELVREFITTRNLKNNQAGQIKALVKILMPRLAAARDDEEALRSLATNISEGVDAALARLDLLCKRAAGAAVKIHFVSGAERALRDLHEKLLPIIVNADDVLVVLDAVYLTRDGFPNLLVIVTTDTWDLYNNRVEIEQHISPIVIKLPEDC